MYEDFKNGSLDANVTVTADEVQPEEGASGDTMSNGTSESNATVRPRPIVVSGPSGCGKSTILKRLFEEYPKAFAFSVSHTTRKPRPGECDGVDYHYVERTEMEQMIMNHEFLEHAEFGGNLYGTSQRAVENVQNTGRVCILDLEIQGVRSLHQTDLNPLFIYVRPPSMEVLEERLRGRQTENEESLQKRLKRAKEDTEQVAADPKLFDCEVINDQIEQAYTDFKVAIKDVLNRFTNDDK